MRRERTSTRTTRIVGKLTVGQGSGKDVQRPVRLMPIQRRSCWATSQNSDCTSMKFMSKPTSFALSIRRTLAHRSDAWQYKEVAMFTAALVSLVFGFADQPVPMSFEKRTAVAQEALDSF